MISVLRFVFLFLTIILITGYFVIPTMVNVYAYIIFIYDIMNNISWEYNNK